MKLLNKRDLSFSRTLSISECESLKDTNSISKNALLTKIRNNGLWVACDCVEPAPLMTVRLKDEKHHLVNLNQGGKHKNNCYFISIDRDQLPKNIEKTGMKNTFLLHRGSVERTTDPNSSPTVSSGDNKKQVEDSLFKLVSCLFESANINTIDHKYKSNYKEKVKKILSSSKQFRVGGKALDSILYWGIKNHEKAFRSLESEVNKSSDINKVPMRLVISVIDEFIITDMGMKVVSHSYNSQGEKQEFDVMLSEECKITLSSKRFSVTDSPFILIYTLIYDTKDDANYIRTGRAYIKPIASFKNLIPVDNVAEREAINYLENKVIEQTRKGRALKIERPLLNITVPDSQVVIKPDIIINTAEKKYFINIYASDDNQYIKVREGMHHYMQQLAETIVISPFDAVQDKLTVNKQLLHDTLEQILD